MSGVRCWADRACRLWRWSPGERTVRARCVGFIPCPLHVHIGGPAVAFVVSVGLALAIGSLANEALGALIVHADGFHDANDPRCRGNDLLRAENAANKFSHEPTLGSLVTKHASYTMLPSVTSGRKCGRGSKTRWSTMVYGIASVRKMLVRDRAEKNSRERRPGAAASTPERNIAIAL